MSTSDFQNEIKKLADSKAFRFDVFKGDEGGIWYSIELDSGLFEIYIASDLEIGINLPSESDEISLGGCDEVYNNFDEALNRIKGVFKL